MAHEHFDDPVAAYRYLGAEYARLSARRAAYLSGIEALILNSMPAGSRSLLDIGAGDGTRSLRLAKQARIEKIVLLEPAARIARQLSGTVELWPIRAEDLQPDSIPARFDVITCLWNVLGHVPTAARRLRALQAASRLLSPQGRFFLDVNHRYNLLSYGFLATCARFARDVFAPGEKNGNVIVRWTVGDRTITTSGHVFTNREIMRLATSAGLELHERIAVDYESGSVRKLACTGNLLYVFRRSSRMDSSSAPQTS